MGYNSRKYYVLRTPQSGAGKMVIPEGVWVKCAKCGQTLYRDRLADNLMVCWYCGHHLAMLPDARIELLTDDDGFEEFFGDIGSTDFLEFTDSKSYGTRLLDSTAKTGESEAVICGQAKLDGRRYMLGVMDFRFMGASMGSAVGEKITRLVEAATAACQPVVLVTASGGARMQEGILSLMQMAKTCAALSRHSDAGLPYIVIMTNPTYGGVTASFASVGDVIISEPGAMIGFAGPRVIRETTNSTLPEGFQTAEFLLEKGLIDRVVERKKLRKELSALLEFFGAK